MARLGVEGPHPSRADQAFLSETDRAGEGKIVNVIRAERQLHAATLRQACLQNHSTLDGKSLYEGEGAAQLLAEGAGMPT